MMYSEKMKAKYSKEDVWKSVFFVKFQVGISQLHQINFSQTVFRDFKQINAFEWLLLDLV